MTNKTAIPLILAVSAAAVAFLFWLIYGFEAGVATDTWSVEVSPSETPDCERPLQQIAQRSMGLLFGEMFHLDTLSEACAADGNYAFLFTAPLLPMLGAVGYPINPLAIK